MKNLETRGKTGRVGRYASSSGGSIMFFNTLTIHHRNRQYKADLDHIVELLFKIVTKCQNKLDCLIFELLFTRDLKPSLNKHSDSIRANLFALALGVFILLFIAILFLGWFIIVSLVHR